MKTKASKMTLTTIQDISEKCSFKELQAKRVIKSHETVRCGELDIEHIKLYYSNSERSCRATLAHGSFGHV